MLHPDSCRLAAKLTCDVVYMLLLDLQSTPYGSLLISNCTSAKYSSLFLVLLLIFVLLIACSALRPQETAAVHREDDVWVSMDSFESLLLRFTLNKSIVWRGHRKGSLCDVPAATSAALVVCVNGVRIGRGSVTGDNSRCFSGSTAH